MQGRSTAYRVVLITGAGGGLGDALVHAFAAQAWRVVAASHRATRRAGTEAIWPVALDVTQADEAASVVAQTVARWHRLDVLVNNAGLIADRPILQMQEADWDTVLAVNLKGPFLCSQAALRPMLAQRDGHIVNIGSFSGRRGARGQANYAAAKAGLIGLTESLAREVGTHQVRVNAVLPGVLRTAMTARLSEAQLGEFAQANALGCVNAAEEVAAFVVFLAGMQNVSGQVFQLDSRVARWT